MRTPDFMIERATPNDVEVKVGIRKKLGPFLLVLAFSIFLLGANPLDRETISPSHILERFKGWDRYDFDSPQARSMERSDIVDVKIPVWLEVRSLVQNGEDWTLLFSRNGGTNVLDFTHGVFTPAFGIFLLTPEPWLGWYLGLLFQTTAGIYGTFLLARALRVRTWLALSAGMVFMGSGFVTAWFFWPHVSTAIWIPWLLWATINFAEHRRPSDGFAVFLSSSLLILGGFPVVGAFGFYIALSYAALSGPRGSLKVMLKFWLTYVALVTGAFLVTFPALLPFLEMTSAVDLSYRQGGSSLTFQNNFTSLFWPWASGPLQVERNIFVGLLALVVPTLLLVKPWRLLKDIEVRTRIVFFLVWAVFSATYTFDIPFLNLLGVLPGLGTSLFNRGSVIVALMLAVASVLLVEQILTKLEQESRIRKLKGAIVAITTLFVLASLVISKISFSFFNPATPAADFLPPPPGLSNTLALTAWDYALADSTFALNGSLTAFGVREWFSHGFWIQSKDFRDVWRELSSTAYSSPTSVTPKLGDLEFSSSYFDFLNIRYAISASSGEVPILEEKQEGKLEAVRVSGGEVFTQKFETSSYLAISRLEVLLATYGRENLNTGVDLTIWSSEGVAAIKVSIQGSEVKDNSRAEFSFPEIVLPPGSYVFTLTTQAVGDTDPLAVWTKKLDDDGLSGTLNSMELDRSSIFTFFGPLDSANWSLVSDPEGSGLFVLENPDAPMGPYLIGNLDSSARILSKLPLSSKSKIFGEYEIPRDWIGYVVFPIRASTDLAILVDGERATVSKFLGLLPAIQVSGGEIVTIERSHKVWPLLVSLVGGMIVISTIIFIAKTHRARRRTPSP